MEELLSPFLPLCLARRDHLVRYDQHYKFSEKSHPTKRVRAAPKPLRRKGNMFYNLEDVVSRSGSKPLLEPVGKPQKLADFVDDLLRDPLHFHIAIPSTFQSAVHGMGAATQD